MSDFRVEVNVKNAQTSLPCRNCKPHFIIKTNYCYYCNKKFKPKQIKNHSERKI